ncbi:MAG: hypothetical protein CK425_04160 [Parachlamydia sp.]|nr:MAG: hypothetical protein CK425_04160 [Parachlamydia sp.]
MRSIYETKSSATNTYPPEKQAIVSHAGQSCKKMGKSYKKLTLSGNAWHLFKLFSGVLVLPWFFRSYREDCKISMKEIKQQKEKIIHFEYLKNPQKPKPAPTFTFKFPFADHILPKEIFAANCYLKAELAKGTVQQEFIFESPGQSAMSKEAFKQKTEKMQTWCESLKKDLGEIQKIEWVLVLKDRPLDTPEAYSVFDYHKSQNGFSESEASGEDTFEALPLLLEQIGFPPKTTFVENGQFVPGQTYNSPLNTQINIP